jgi:hypothetical protein
MNSPFEVKDRRILVAPNNGYMDRHKILLILSTRIEGTAYTGRLTVEDMGVNHHSRTECYSYV